MFTDHVTSVFADAVKKIVLESEEGKFATVGAIQNRKLRREVTTISRMMHKNIVRYFQAWVEGGSTETRVEEEQQDVVEDENEPEDDESLEEGSGWWTNSPTEGVPDALRSRGDDTEDLFSNASSDDGSWVAEDDDTLDMSNPLVLPPRHDDRSGSIEYLLGEERNFQVRSFLR